MVFDLETGGLDPSRDCILSFGGVRMRGARIEVGSAFEALVGPAGQDCRGGRGPSAESVRVHQLTPAELRCQPPIESVLPSFLAFCGDAVLAGWHVELDLAFLRAWAGRLGLTEPGNLGLDVLGLFLAIRERGPESLAQLPLKDATLYTVARALGISPRGAHHALGDAFLAAQVLQRFLCILRGLNPGGEPNLGALLRLAEYGAHPARACRPAF